MLKFYLLTEEALDEITAAASENLPQRLAHAAEKVVSKEGLDGYVEGYTGILDDYDCDLMDYASDELQEALEEASDDGNAAWVAIPAEQASKLAAALSKVRITGEDAENYFGDEDEAEDVQALHEAFRKVLHDLKAGQVLVFRADAA